MITRPNIGEILIGLTRNLERMAGDAATTDLTQLFTPVLTVLDRVRHEWPSWASLLGSDNQNMRDTLAKLGVQLPAPNDAAEGRSLASRSAPIAIETMEQDNRALKGVLVETIAAF